jgi:hypothetical protein
MRWAVIAAVLLTASQALATDFLRRGEFTFVPSAGNRATTMRPLDPSKRYRVVITATHGYTLSPLLNCYSRQVSGFMGVLRDKTFCTVKLLFNSQVLTPYLEHTNMKWGYFLFDFNPDIYYNPSVEAYLYGDGRRLSVSIQDDLTYAIPELRLAITDIDYVQAQQLLESQRQRQLIVEAEQRKLREAERQQRIREEQAALRRDQYLKALSLIALLAILTVVVGLICLSIIKHKARNSRSQGARHLSARPVNKTHRVQGLPEQTRR